MTIERFRFVGALLAVALLIASNGVLAAQDEDPCSRGQGAAPGYADTPVIPGQKWKVHDISRPQPPLVTPGKMVASTPAPSDAVVLFDGKDLSAWQQRVKRGPDRGKLITPTWKIEDGYTEVASGSGNLVSKEKFGDIQMHIEWAAPADVCGYGQWRGNSGVMIMGRYEFQVLDSIDNPTYADGKAGSIYGQWPPLVNASRERGEWQSFDIVFEAPEFDGDKVVEPAYVTIFHNGVLVQHRKKIIGPVAHRNWRKYTPHGPEESIVLQDHDVPVRFRNIWVRRLKGYDQN